ncbi:MAG: YeeE/YedE family protein, partial [Gammaproteobacteria bacterium]|nr:YeeE/YedE family protein [Gammaproteobacteria bacterium]
MTIDWNAFTPAAALIGGALIGLAAAILVVFNGRIAGISGILGGLLDPSRGEVAWRVAFLLGLLLAP